MCAPVRDYILSSMIRDAEPQLATDPELTEILADTTFHDLAAI
jgi:hypothetical protein